MGDILARPLIRLLASLQWEIELVIPVPLGFIHQTQRGYNQAALLAFPLAMGSGLIYSGKALRKVRETASQVGLSLAARRDNVAGAFWADSSKVGRKKVLVVDDVRTSGATLNACAGALLQAGADRVYAITLARAAALR